MNHQFVSIRPLPHGRGSEAFQYGAAIVKRSAYVVFVVSFLLPVAHAQFAISVVTGTGETPVTSRYDFGTVSTGDIATAQFRLRNTTNGPATVTLLAVAGAGFTLSAKPALPLTDRSGDR